MSSPSASRIAQALAQANAMGGQSGEPGLESPFEQRLLQNAGIAASGYGAGSMGATLLKALASKSLPAMEGLGEAGAIFPKGTPPESLPVIPSGSKVGDPHALFAYTEHPDFGGESMYNVWGDPAHPLIQKAGHGSTVSMETLEKLGIPVIGREPPRSFTQKAFR